MLTVTGCSSLCARAKPARLRQSVKQSPARYKNPTLARNAFADISMFLSVLSALQPRRRGIEHLPCHVRGPVKIDFSFLMTGQTCLGCSPIQTRVDCLDAIRLRFEFA